MHIWYSCELWHLKSSESLYWLGARDIRLLIIQPSIKKKRLKRGMFTLFWQKKYIIRLSFSFEIFCFSSFLLFWPPAALLLCVQRRIYKPKLPPKPGLLSHSQKGCSWNGAYCTLCTIQRSHFLSEPRSPKEKNIILINGSDMCYPFFYLFIFGVHIE